LFLNKQAILQQISDLQEKLSNPEPHWNALSPFNKGLYGCNSQKWWDQEQERVQQLEAYLQKEKADLQKEKVNLQKEKADVQTEKIIACFCAPSGQAFSQ
jgi:hypothetical protein